MVGTVVMIVILLLFPVVVLMSMAVLAALLGTLVNRSVDEAYEGHELLELSRPPE